MSPKIHEINEIDELAAHRADWARLWAETPGASFFQSLEWLEAYWRHYAADQRLRVLIHERDGRVEGILPLVVRPERHRVGLLRVLTYPLDYWGSFYGPLGRRTDETLAAGLEHIATGPRDWDMVELRWLGSPGTEPETTTAAMRSTGLPASLGPMDLTAILDLEGSWDSYLESRPRAWRRNLRAAERRLREEHTVEYIRYRPRGEAFGEGDPRFDLYAECEQIARRSWQADAPSGTTLASASIRPFLHDAHAAAAACGALDLHLLRVDGLPAAFMYCYASRGRLYGLRSGYDREFKSLEVGNVLLARAIEDSLHRGDRLFDLGVGSLEAKRIVPTRLVTIHRASHYGVGPRAQLLRLGRWFRSLGYGPKWSTAVGHDQDGAADAR